MVSNRTLFQILLAVICLLVIALLVQFNHYTAIIMHLKEHRSASTTFASPDETTVVLKPLKTAKYTIPRGKDAQMKSPNRLQNNAKVVESKDDSHTDNAYPSNSIRSFTYGDDNCPKNKDKNILAKLFEKWIEIAKREKIEYFLTCGSLLGSYRNGELIPHDTDIDVLINREDFGKIKTYHSKKKFVGTESDFFVYINRDFHLPFEKRRRFSCKGKEVPAYMDHCSFQEPLGRIITENRHIDIYDYTRKGNQLWDPSEGGRTFNENEVFPLRRCFFMGYETTCPNRPREFLKKFYGNDLAPLKVCKNGKWVKRKS